MPEKMRYNKIIDLLEARQAGFQHQHGP